MPLYKVKSNIRKDGQDYLPGSDIVLTEEQAEQIAHAVEAIPEEPLAVLPEVSVKVNGVEIPCTIESMPGQPGEGIPLLEASEVPKHKPLANLMSKTRSGKKEK